jgi:proteic killer suppression protein
MRIVSTRHRGLRSLLEADEPRGLRRDLAPRVRNILSVLVAARTMDEVRGPPGWRIHQLSGQRAGTWSISVSGNWRITFRVVGDEIHDLDLEDYH